MCEKTDEAQDKPEEAHKAVDPSRAYRDHLMLDDIRCDILNTGWPLGDDTDPELTPRRLVRELLEEIAFMRHQRDNPQAAVDRRRARERFLLRESVLIRQIRAELEAAYQANGRSEAAIAAYLRSEAERIRKGEYEPASREYALLDAADAIERGEYLRPAEGE